MLDHISIGVSDLERSTEFYDAVLAPLGYVRIFNGNHASGYAPPGERDDPFAIRRDAGFEPPSGLHIAFAARSRDAVVRFHEAAVRLGATSDGEPGLHPEYCDGYFAAFVLDPDGYRLEAVLHEKRAAHSTQSRRRVRATDLSVGRVPEISDKRVFDIAAATPDGGARRVLAISADATVLDLYLALLGAFRWRGDFDRAEQTYRVAIGSRIFEFGKGQRTALRRVLDVGSNFECSAPGLDLRAEVSKSYTVASRRHFPKVLDGAGVGFNPQLATWEAQGAMRREFRE